MFPKNKNQKIQENPRNYLFSSNKNEQNSEDLNQKIRTANKYKYRLPQAERSRKISVVHSYKWSMKRTKMSKSEI